MPFFPDELQEDIPGHNRVTAFLLDAYKGVYYDWCTPYNKRAKFYDVCVKYQERFGTRVTTKLLPILWEESQNGR